VSFTFVIPAYNEADRIGSLLTAIALADVPQLVIVVDNGSTDGTSQIAANAGATVISEPRRGKGFAVHTGVLAATTDHVFLCDADIEGFSVIMAEELMETRRPGEKVARLALGRSPELAPVTLLCAQPLLATIGHVGMAEPLGGLAMVERDFLLNAHLPGDWGFDVAITLAACSISGPPREMPVRGVSHRSKSLPDYVEMAEEVTKAILRWAGLTPWDHSTCVRCVATASVSRSFRA